MGSEVKDEQLGEDNSISANTMKEPILTRTTFNSIVWCLLATIGCCWIGSFFSFVFFWLGFMLVIPVWLACWGGLFWKQIRIRSALAGTISFVLMLLLGTNNPPDSKNKEAELQDAYLETAPHSQPTKKDKEVTTARGPDGWIIPHKLEALASEGETTDTYQATVLGPNPGRLYPSVAAAQKFLNANLDTMVAMARRGYFNDMPLLQEGETVTASKEHEDIYRYVITMDGKSGYYSAFGLTLPPEEQRDNFNNDPNVVMVTSFFSEHPAPPVQSMTNPAVVCNVQYKITKLERIVSIGHEGKDESWAKAAPSHRYLVVSYTAKNLGDDSESLSNVWALVDKEGNIYPFCFVASNAFWEKRKMTEPEEIQPGGSVEFAEAFAVPDSVPNKHLRLLIGDPGSINLFPVQIELQ